jgi:sigma-B regulation protein RsbU (phosphoserine phosphatase)
MPAAPPRTFPADDLPALLAGTVILAAALLVLGVYLARRRTRQGSTLDFAAVCFLYGARLIVGTTLAEAVVGPERARDLETAITYLINIPFVLFVEDMFVRGWRGTIRVLRIGWVVFAAVALGGWAAGLDRLWAMPLNNVFVIAAVTLLLAHLFGRTELPNPERRVMRGAVIVFALFAVAENLRGLGLLPVPAGAEFVGFLALLGGLAWIVARRVFENERRLAALDSELATARRIQASILPRGVPTVPRIEAAVRYVPAAAVAGDFYDFLAVEDGRLGALLADVSGHGVPAALVASMVKVGASAEAVHARDPARVLGGLNRLFCASLDGAYVTAACVYLDRADGRLAYASAGHPPGLLWRAAAGRLERLDRNGLLLGFAPEAAYETVEVPLAEGDRLLLYTDGLVEAANAADEPFDEERLRTFVAENARLPAPALADALLGCVRAWTGRPGFEDDVTLLVLDAC